MLTGALLAFTLALAPGPTTLLLADFSQPEELGRWQLENAGPKSQRELVPGPDGLTAVQVTGVYEPQLQPQGHSPAPYMPFRRPLDGAAAARAGTTRITFWHRGDSVQLVLNVRGGPSYYTGVDASPEWRRVECPLGEFAYGWGPDPAGALELAKVDSLHFAIAPPPGASRRFAVADVRLVRATDDLDPDAFIGPPTPARLDLYPRTLAVPANRTQPLLVVVANEARSPLANQAVTLELSGDGRLTPLDDRRGERGTTRLTLTTDAEGKAHARFHPGRAGGTATLTARLGALTAEATLTGSSALTKPRLGADGFFAGADGQRLVLLGGLFLPWWSPIKDGQPAGMSPVSVIGASEAEQQDWFAYLHAHGVNCVRGYWPWGAPLKLGPGGSEVVHNFYLDGRVNEPVVAALERAMAVGGHNQVGFTLTIADPARPFLAPGGKLPAGKSRRQVMLECLDDLRELVPRLHHNPNVWAYELTNEQKWSVFDASERVIRAIKDLDDDTPVMVSHWGGALQTADPLPWMRKTSLDVYQPHLYPDRGHSLFGPTVDSGLIQEVHENAMAGPKPWLLGESGGYGTHPPLGPAPDATAQRYLARDCIWFALLNRSVGAFIWGIQHWATVEFGTAAKIAPTIDWAALARAKAPLGVAVPRDPGGDQFFRTEPGKQALAVMAQYARWGLEHGQPLDFPADAAGYRLQRSALAPFDPPAEPSPFDLGPGYQLKVRLSADGSLAVGYLRNLDRIELYKPEKPANWGTWDVSGSYLRKRKPTTAKLGWRLPAARYALNAWDLDDGTCAEVAVEGAGGTWQRADTDHDYLLVWRAAR